MSHFLILRTPLMHPLVYYDQDFMAQRWLHQQGFTYQSSDRCKVLLKGLPVGSKRPPLRRCGNKPLFF